MAPLLAVFESVLAAARAAPPEHASVQHYRSVATTAAPAASMASDATLRAELAASTCRPAPCALPDTAGVRPLQTQPSAAR